MPFSQGQGQNRSHVIGWWSKGNPCYKAARRLGVGHWMNGDRVLVLYEVELDRDGLWYFPEQLLDKMCEWQLASSWWLNLKWLDKKFGDLEVWKYSCYKRKWNSVVNSEQQDGDQETSKISVNGSSGLLGLPAEPGTRQARLFDGYLKGGRETHHLNFDRLDYLYPEFSDREYHLRAIALPGKRTGMIESVLSRPRSIIIVPL